MRIGVNKLKWILQHAAKCGDGASIFLSVHSTLVLIVDDRRGAVWGSVYLDSHGEEDRNLKYVSTFIF